MELRRSVYQTKRLTAGPSRLTLAGTFFLKCCFTSTETMRTIRDGEPRAATSTFTQLLRSDL